MAVVVVVESFIEAAVSRTEAVLSRSKTALSWTKAFLPRAETFPAEVLALFEVIAVFRVLSDIFVITPAESRTERALRTVAVLAEAAAVDLICVLGGTFGKVRGHVPLWARKRDRKDPEGMKMPPDSYLGRAKPGYRAFLPQLEDWRNYVAAVAARYRGRIRFYEILNEPNLTMTAPMYLPYLESAAEEIRRVDPEAVILGLCSTSDFGGNLEDFVGQCLKLGAARSLDCITIHPYCTLDNSVPRTQMKMRRDVLANLRKVGVKAGLWNGENYYVLPSSRPWTEHAGRVRPEDIARHILVDLGEGCVGSTPTSMTTLSSCRIQATQADAGMNVRLFPEPARLC